MLIYMRVFMHHLSCDGYAIIPNGRPTWAPLLAASGQPRHRRCRCRGRPDKASRCGNPAKCCSEKTPFAGRRPPVAVRKTMPHGPVMYITMKKAVARCSWSVARKTMPHVLVMYIAIYSRRAALAGSAPTHKADGRVFCVLQNCGNRHSFHRLYAIS